MTTLQPVKNTCDTCNAPHTNTLHRIFIRCGTCHIKGDKLPSNYRPIEEAKEATQ